MPTDDEVVQTAAEAAENVIFSRLGVSEVEDYDVTVTFEGGVLDVDVYVNAPDSSADERRLADDGTRPTRGSSKRYGDRWEPWSSSEDPTDERVLEATR